MNTHRENSNSKTLFSKDCSLYNPWKIKFSSSSSSSLSLSLSGIRRSRVAMNLCLVQSRSASTGAAPVVAVQADTGVTVPTAVAALESGVCRACWPFLRLTLSSSDASCSSSSPLGRSQFSSCLQRDRSKARFAYHPSTSMSRVFVSLLSLSGACWLFLCLTLSSSDASCSVSFPLRRSRFSSQRERS